MNEQYIRLLIYIHTIIRLQCNCSINVS